MEVLARRQLLSNPAVASQLFRKARCKGIPALPFGCFLDPNPACFPTLISRQLLRLSQGTEVGVYDKNTPLPQPPLLHLSCCRRRFGMQFSLANATDNMYQLF